MLSYNNHYFAIIAINGIVLIKVQLAVDMQQDPSLILFKDTDSTHVVKQSNNLTFLMKMDVFMFSMSLLFLKISYKLKILIFIFPRSI